MVNEFAGANFTCTANITRCFSTGEQVLSRYGMQNVVVWKWCLVLIGMVIGYRVLSFLALWKLNSEKR